MGKSVSSCLRGNAIFLVLVALQKRLALLDAGQRGALRICKTPINNERIRVAPLQNSFETAPKSFGFQNEKQKQK